MTLRYSQQKIESALQLLAEFKAGSFPHDDSIQAIDSLTTLLTITRQQFSSSNSSSLTAQTEMEATALISQILDLLGVISNSANVRNSFEIHGPVLELAKTLLGDTNAKLIISFEWNYIPYTIPQTHPLLPNFVIIGLPASEASNALVLPALGHELGHSLWLKDKCRDYFEANITKTMVDAIKGSQFRDDFNKLYNNYGVTADTCDDYNNLWTWQDASEYCFRQVEETFSDFTGLMIFGQAYLDSFEYLLSPSLSPERSSEYPEIGDRAKYLESHAARIGVTITSPISGSFEKQIITFYPGWHSNLRIRLADFARATLVESIADHARDLCTARNISPPDNQETLRISENFMEGVPTENTSGLGGILNAGWSCFKNKEFIPENDDPVRMKIINELVLKSVEIYEIERMSAP